MKKLSKDQLAQHTKFSAELHDAHEELDGAITRYNAKVAAAFAELQPFVETFNSKVTEVTDFVEEIHGEQQSFYDEKSERWQESDAGTAYSDWMGTWDQDLCDLDLVELQAAPNELETPEVDLDSKPRSRRKVS